MKKTALSCLISVVCSLSAQAYQQDKTYHLTVLHTNDLHGRFYHNEKGEGGLAAQKTVIDRIKKEVEAKGGSTIVLSAGDFNTGIAESSLQNARPDIEGMNAIGYEALTLGNHEFDNPRPLLEKQKQWAKFPFLAANIHYKKQGKGPMFPVDPYTILHKQDLKIAVVGLTTTDTATSANPAHTRDFTFLNPQEVSKEIGSLLEETEKPDIKIALTHLGYYENGLHGDKAPGDVSLARALPAKTFDMIIGGHTHDTVCMDNQGHWNKHYQPGEPCRPDFQNGTWIMQAGEWGKYVGRADFEFKNGELTLKNYQLIPINLKKEVKDAEGKKTYVTYQEAIPADPQLAALLDQYQHKGDELLGVKVGHTNGRLEGERKIIRFQQTNLGKLFAYVQMQKVGADLSVVNSGGVRDSIEAGDVTYKDVLKVAPFGNTITYVELTGAELEKYLQVVGLKRVDSGGYAQFAGVSMLVDWQHQTVSDIKIQGKPLNPRQKYRLAVSNFCAIGGSGYPVLTQYPSYVDTGYVDADVLKEFFEQNSPLDVKRFAPNNEIIYKN